MDSAVKIYTTEFDNYYNKSKFDWGDKIDFWHRVKVDSGIELPMVHVLELTLESTYTTVR